MNMINQITELETFEFALERISHLKNQDTLHFTFKSLDFVNQIVENEAHKLLDIKVEKDEEHLYHIYISKKDAVYSKQTIILITKDQLGDGDIALSKILIKSFIGTLTQSDVSNHILIFLNSGVKLCCENSNVVEDLTLIKNNGAMLLNCQTCLDFYDLSDKLEVGSTTNMYEITSLLGRADKVITL